MISSTSAFRICLYIVHLATCRMDIRDVLSWMPLYRYVPVMLRYNTVCDLEIHQARSWTLRNAGIIMGRLERWTST